MYKPSVWSRSTAYCHCTFQLIFLQMQKKYKYSFSSILILENETNAIYCLIFSPLYLWRMGLAGPPSMITIKQHWTRAGNRGQHSQQFCALPFLSSSGLTIKSLRGDILVWDVDRLGSLSTLPCVTAEQTDNTVRNKSSAPGGRDSLESAIRAPVVLELGNWREEVKLYQIRGYFLCTNEIQKLHRKCFNPGVSQTLNGKWKCANHNTDCHRYYWLTGKSENIIKCCFL